MTGQSFLRKLFLKTFIKNKPLIISLLCDIVDSLYSLFCVSVRGDLGSFIPLLAPSFLPLTLVYNVKYIPKNRFLDPLQPAFDPSLFTPSVGVKSAIGDRFLLSIDTFPLNNVIKFGGQPNFLYLCFCKCLEVSPLRRNINKL